MREVIGELVEVGRVGERAALATVISTWASAPRQAGAAMLVRADGAVAGSVSGGCVEGEVYEICREVAVTGQPTTQRYGVSDADAFAAGLPCGGSVEVYVEPAAFAEVDSLAEQLAAQRPVALVTFLDGGGHRVVTGAGGFTRTGKGIVEGREAFVAVFEPAPRLIVFGATDHAAALAGIGVFLGYRVTICDARPVFATAARFPGADVVVDWPHRYLTAEDRAGRLDARTAVCVLTHDPKFDVPALEIALRLPIGYVGAMGSRRAHAERLTRLREAGLTPADLSRLASPIGLDLGAVTPQETAVSIAAELITLRHNGTGRRLTTTDGPVHATHRLG